MSEIIIDGDVAECVELYELDEMVCIADGTEVSCKGKNCYYKQLKRLEKENAELREEIRLLHKGYKPVELYSLFGKCVEIINKIDEVLK